MAEGAGELGVSRLGIGVVIHTDPATRHRLPVIVGYADNRGKWYQEGSRHVEILEADEATESMEVELGTCCSIRSRRASSASRALPRKVFDTCLGLPVIGSQPDVRPAAPMLSSHEAAKRSDRAVERWDSA
jgi:hypothetical protein